MAIAAAPVPVTLRSGTKRIAFTFYQSTREALLKGAKAKASHFDLVL